MRRKNRGLSREFRDLATSALETFDKPATKTGLTAEIATRSKTIDFISVLHGLPNPDPVLRKLGRAIQVYEDLMFDSRVMAVVESRKAAVQSMEWDIISEKTPQAQIDFHKDYINAYAAGRNIDKKTSRLEDIFSEILDAPLFGYKPLEIIWQPDSGKIIPLDFVGKPPRWFKYDKENKLRFITMANMIEGEELPDNKFIVARHKPTYDNPYGKAALSACFWPVTFRKNGFKFWTIFLEKYGMPFLLATAPEGERTEKIEEVANMLEDMVQDAIAVVPKEYEVEIKEATEGKGTNPAHKTYIDAMNLEIAMAIIGTNLTTEVQGGSYAASQSHMKIREDIVESDAKIAEGAFNELISMAHNINFGSSTPPPVFKLFAEENIDETRSKRDLNLSKTGVKFTKDYFKRVYNLTDEDLEVGESVKEPAFGGGDNE